MKDLLYLLSPRLVAESCGGALSENHISLHDEDEDTHRDLQTLGLVSAVQVLPPGLDLTLVHQAENYSKIIFLCLLVPFRSIPLCSGCFDSRISI